MSICSTHHRRCGAEKGAEWVRRWRVWLQTRAARCGVYGACRTLCSCDNSNAPPRGTDARTEGPALGPTVYSYLLLLAVERSRVYHWIKDDPTGYLASVV
jgi:hypothetical protein